MKGDPSVVATLNELLAVELTAVHQYTLRARLCERWGYERLYEKIHEESREELEHADHLVARILFLEGTPDVQRVGAIAAATSVEEGFRADLALESGGIVALNRGIEGARRAGDNGTADLLQEILEDTEEHAHWLESQLALIAQMGLPAYLAEQIASRGGEG